MLIDVLLRRGEGLGCASWGSLMERGDRWVSFGVGCVLVSHVHHPRHRLEACGAPVFDSLEQILGNYS